MQRSKKRKQSEEEKEKNICKKRKTEKSGVNLTTNAPNVENATLNRSTEYVRAATTVTLITPQHLLFTKVLLFTLNDSFNSFKLFSHFDLYIVDFDLR
jgi:hypothetical protein